MLLVKRLCFFDEILLTVPTTNTEFSISVLLRACGKSTASSQCISFFFNRLLFSDDEEKLSVEFAQNGIDGIRDGR